MNKIKEKVSGVVTTIKKSLFGNGDNSVKKDWWFAGILVVGFLTILNLIIWVSGAFGISEAFNLMNFYMVIAKAGFVSAVVWSMFKFVFAGTLGKDFGKRFDEGWEEMSSIEKTRWIIGVFVAIFVVLVSTF